MILGGGRLLLAALAIAAIAPGGCDRNDRAAAATFGSIAEPDASTAAALGAILEGVGVNTAAIGVMKSGELAWSHVYGEVRPGVEATASPRLNVASITKTVVAETAMRLAADGVIDLDEPLAPYLLDPDVADDPRALQLTARHVLSHGTGLPNWRFFTPGGHLAFEAVPGERYGYSGEGFEWLARAIEAKTGCGFPQVVQETVLDPASPFLSRYERARPGPDQE